MTNNYRKSISLSKYVLANISRNIQFCCSHSISLVLNKLFHKYLHDIWK